MFCNIRIIEWFELKDILKIFLVPNFLSLARISSTTPGCSKPHPTLNTSSIETSTVSPQPVSVPHHSYSEEFPHFLSKPAIFYFKYVVPGPVTTRHGRNSLFIFILSPLYVLKDHNKIPPEPSHFQAKKLHVSSKDTSKCLCMHSISTTFHHIESVTPKPKPKPRSTLHF